MIQVPGYYAGIVLLLYVIGLLLGSCGSVGGGVKKTGGYCICFGTGANFTTHWKFWTLVNLPIFLGMFLIVSMLLWAFTIVMFFSGGAVQVTQLNTLLLINYKHVANYSLQKGVCDTLEDPESSQLYDAFNEEFQELLNETLGEEFAGEQWNLADILDVSPDGILEQRAFNIGCFFLHRT